jgi:leucine dehydrogenase
VTPFDHPAFDDHEEVAFFAGEPSGLRAIVAIHRISALGGSGGGCRMWPYRSTDDALTDALRLSRAMSYKLALMDLPAGGAKVVVIGDPIRGKTEALLRALGRAVETLHGRFIVAEDVGTTPDDMRIIGQETPYVLRQQGDTAAATAYGVLLGMRDAVRHRLGVSDLDGLRVGVQGAGRVGLALCRLLADAGARVLVSDVRDERTALASRDLGVEVADGRALLEQELDVLAPCAMGGVLDDVTIPRLRCAVVAGSANEQLAESRHAALLSSRAVLYVPDFVHNAGGVLAASDEALRIGANGVCSGCDRIPVLLRAIFAQAQRERVTPYEVALAMAREKCSKARRPAWGGAQASAIPPSPERSELT